MRRMTVLVGVLSLLLVCVSCVGEGGKMEFNGEEGQVKLMTLDPGHFHAALVQKTMYPQVSPSVYVYAPAGPEVEGHWNIIKGYNTRAESPTSWEEKVYTGDDFFEKMLEERPGNVVVISGNNRKKAEYIRKCAEAGLNVLADKPMCIDKAGYKELKKAFDAAKKNDVLIYDIMTERSEITTILQKKLVHDEAVFGELEKGTVDDPAVVKESVHHFFKYVSGNPIKRPGWYFDTTQQGEGIVDVTTHLVDLVMWETFPGKKVKTGDIKIEEARRWPTVITKEQYKKVTGLDSFPDYLKDDVEGGALLCYANGEIVFEIKDVMAKVSVVWNFQAPEGGGDTHYSIMKGTKANVLIRQGAEQNYKPELYVEAAEGADTAELGRALSIAVSDLQACYPGVGLKKEGDMWHVTIPDKYRVGHEAHFGQVTERYLEYLEDGKLPAWEVPNMKAKYYTTTEALELAD